MRDYFRQRFLGDLERSHPAFVLDAVAHGSFGFEDADSDGLASFSALASSIETDFVRLSDPSSGSRCPRLYVRHDRWNVIAGRQVGIARTTATARYAGSVEVGPERLIDNDVFETCDDFWLLPDGATGSAVVEFSERSSIQRVWLLNTANREFGDRASRRVRIDALRGGETIRSQETDLAPYPEWTTVDLPAHHIDAIQVEVLSFHGKGGGLNEIKIFR
jgi:hypothetical protein